MSILETLFEKREHPSNPSDWLLYGLGNGGQGTYAGITINETNALSTTAVFACIKVLSEGISSLPLHLYKRKAGQGRERAVSHPHYDLMHLRPNPEMTSMVYRETMAGHLVTWGNCYSNIERNLAGQIKGLWPLRPDKMKVYRVNGKLQYVYTLPDGAETRLAREEVLHIPGLGFDGITGYSPIAKAREAIGLAMATEEFGARFFGNGARPAAVLEHPGRLGDGIDNLKKSWKDAHEGLSKSHKIAILEEGMKLHEIGIPPEDAQFLATREFQVIEIARIFNVPPHLIKDLTHATYSNIEQMSLEFVTYTLRPWLVRLEQNYSVQLLQERELRKYYFEHLVDGLLRGDIKSRYDAYAVGRDKGWLSANDIREMENMNPLEKGGDVYIVPLNMQPINWLSENPPPPPPPKQRSIEARSSRGRERIRNAYHGVFLDASQRIVNREVIAVKRGIKKHLGQRNIQSFDQWLEEFYGDMEGYILRAFAPVLQTYAEAIQAEAAREIDGDIGMTPELDQFVNEYLAVYSTRHILSSLGQLEALVRDTDINELEVVLEERATNWSEKRPEAIADNETHRMGNAIASAVFLSGGYKIVWQTSGKPCPFCANLDGAVIGWGQHFVGGDSELTAEGQEPMKIRTPRIHPPLHKGCVCSIGAQ